ncbi:MAG: leucine-rich repeat domain-containing protein [Clostridia bacterium]|nr:leucine-rich repeat domain-containing protein [Clostridia bacterium]
MKNSALRLIIALMVLLTVMLCCGAAMAASSGTCGDNLTWTLSDDGMLVISGSGAMDDYEYAEAPWVGGYSSSEYGLWNDRVRSVVIEDGVTTIGDCAFSGFDVSSVYLPASLTRIGDYAFMDCCELKQITIPAGVTNISQNAFLNNGMESIYVVSNNPAFMSDAGVLYSKDGTTLVRCPEKKNRLQILPSVTSIGPYACMLCSNLTGVDIPAGVTSIGECAFSSCSNLASLTIPAGIIRIEPGTFSGCRNLTEIIIPSGVTYIGSSAFESCDGLTEVTLPINVTSMGEYVFRGCINLTNVIIPEGVTTIGGEIFAYCENVTQISLPASVSNVGDAVFSGMRNLTGIAVDENNPYFSEEDGVLYNKDKSVLICCPSGKESLSIPSTVTEIANGACLGCENFTTVVLHDGITSIGNRAFSECYGLSGIMIPATVTSIGADAFRYSYQMTNIDVDTDNQYYASVDGVLYNKAKTALIRCPEGKQSLTIPPSVTSLADYAFCDCGNLTNISLPDNITAIGTSVFDGCGSLTGIKLPERVITIGDNAFSSCYSLTSIMLPAGVVSVGDNAFRDCDSLSQITLYNGVTTIGRGAFSWCNSLSHVTYIGTPDQWASIAIGIDNKSFTSASLKCIYRILTLPEGVTDIESEAFAGLPNVDAVRIPACVTTIAPDAFEPGMVLIVPVGSEWVQWARNNGYHVIEE